MANILTMSRQFTAGYIISEAAGSYRSRDQGEVNGGAAPGLLAGTVLGRLSTGTAVAAAVGGNTGNPTSSAVTVAADADPGVYRVTFLTPTTFAVTRPDGGELPNGATGVAYATQIGFTLTVGVTPAVAGDSFTMTVTKVPGYYVRHDLAGGDGSQTIAGILFEGIIGSGKRTITKRATEVAGAELIYSAGATAGQIATANAALAALGIIVR